MRVVNVVLAAVGTVALSGCIISDDPGRGRGHGRGHASGGVSVGISADFTYFPTYRAYFSESRGEWWVMGGGGWVSVGTRPAHIVITDDTPWVVVNVDGPDPQVRFTEHAHAHPADSHGKGPKGPPPGRGWRK